ncbi:protein kinase domain-containing protein [Legionella sp. D16C41]|uniref:protein kinase domain-containing protein n=1 Tax=Legionella sp. D16C41 TaxID=3402688 RepID=UPI003AF98C83
MLRFFNSEQNLEEVNFSKIAEKLANKKDGLHELEEPKRTIFKNGDNYYVVVRNLSSGSFGKIDLLEDYVKKQFVLKTMEVTTADSSHKKTLKSLSESDVFKKIKTETLEGSRSAPISRKVNTFQFTSKEIREKAERELKALQHLNRTPMGKIIIEENLSANHELMHFYILMDYCGTPVFDIIKDKQKREEYTLENYLDIAISLSEDLQALHQPSKYSLGYYHGDLQPKNILISELADSHLKASLVDFGNAAQIVQQEVVTSTAIWKDNKTGKILDEENYEEFFNPQYELVSETKKTVSLKLQAEHPRAGTPGYCDPNYVARSTAASEIYELGINLAELFDFGQVETSEEHNIPIFKLNDRTPTNEEKDIYDLIISMISEDETKRPDLSVVIGTLNQHKGNLQSVNIEPGSDLSPILS